MTTAKKNLCQLCRKSQGQHKAASLACPMGRRHRTLGYMAYHAEHRFTQPLQPVTTTKREPCPWCRKMLLPLCARNAARDRKDWQGKEHQAPYAPGTRPHKCDRRKMPVEQAR